MNKTRILCLLIALSFSLTHSLWAQDDYVEPQLEAIRKPYKLSDNLYYGASFGTSYSLSSFVMEEPPFKMLRPTIDFHFGKLFSKTIGARVSLGYHCQAASIGREAVQTIYEYSNDEDIYSAGPIYSVHMANVAADAIINLNHLVGFKSENAKFSIKAVAGVGMNIVFGDSPKIDKWTDYIEFDKGFKVAPEFHAGAIFSFRTSENRTFNIQCTWHQTSKDYNGLNTIKTGRHYVELTFGYSKRLLNQYAAYKFENCRGNEKFYFELNEEKMLKEYAKLQKKLHKHKQTLHDHPSANDTILSFPHTYAYLTPLQVSKLEKMVNKLKETTDTIAVIHIYPHASRRDDMTLEQSVDRCKSEISETITHLWGEEGAPVFYQEHNTEYSPIAPHGIWFHNAFIRYERSKK